MDFVSLPLQALAESDDVEGDGIAMTHAIATLRVGGVPDWISQTSSQRGVCSDKGVAKALRKLVNLITREDVQVSLLAVREVVKVAISIDYIIGSCGMCGHATIVGAPGVGRKECLKLVTFAHSGRWFEPVHSLRFSKKQLKGTFVDAVLSAGVEGRCSVMYVDESALVAELPGFDTGILGVCQTLEFANSLVSSADESVRLFSPDELG